MDDNNYIVKVNFIDNFLENASDGQIDELFSKVVDLVNGKNKPVAIPFQPVNPMPQLITPIVIPIELNKLSSPYFTEIMCEECGNDDGYNDYVNWLGR